MRHSSSNIFRTSLAFHPSSLTARRRMRVGDRGVGSEWCTTTGSCYGTRDMEAPHVSWSVLTCGGSPKEGMHESRSDHATS
jgi:hypothetical protein